jgi:serine/threonine-protein kinase HipA
MAAEAGIEMSQCRLLEEGGATHFVTRRFDRTPAGDRLHMQSLAALGHYDFNAPTSYSYEQAFLIMRQLRLPMKQSSTSGGWSSTSLPETRTITSRILPS